MRFTRPAQKTANRSCHQDGAWWCFSCGNMKYSYSINARLQLVMLMLMLMGGYAVGSWSTRCGRRDGSCGAGRFVASEKTRPEKQSSRQRRNASHEADSQHQHRYTPISYGSIGDIDQLQVQASRRYSSVALSVFLLVAQVGPWLQFCGSKPTAAGVGHGLLVRGGGATVAAAPLSVTLFATACLSAVLEGRTKAGALVGAPLLSFGTFCILSNLRLVPVMHPVYDYCWSFLLPLSLSIIILGNPAVAGGEQYSGLSPSEPPNLALSSSEGSVGPLRRVGVAFMIGAVGSVVGVGASFFVATNFAWGAFSLPREIAAQMAGAVTATYVGGSVNLFAVATAVGLVGATSAGGASLLGALAAADIFLMSVYFSFLVAAHKAFVKKSSPSLDQVDGNSGSSKLEGEAATPADGWLASLRRGAKNTLALLAIGCTICSFGNAVAGISPLPGTSTMVVTLLTVGVTRVLTGFASNFQASLSRTAPVVATVLLNAFFGSVGASGRLTDVVGVAPAIFLFASLALAVHVTVMATGAVILNACCGTRLGVDDLIIASNANIGGPSTAATFAGLLGKDELVVPAAVWGTVGYAIATTLGVGVWIALR